MTPGPSNTWEAPPSGKPAQRAQEFCALIPVLETSRLRMRAPCTSDFQLWAEIEMSDRAVYMGGPFSREGAWLDFSQVVAGWILRGFGLWSVERRSDGELIGFVLLNMEYGDFEPEIGYLLAESAEAKGYATEAAKAVSEYAAAEIGKGHAVSYIDPKNTASVRVAEKVGAWHDKSAQPCDGKILVYRHGVPGEAS